MNTTIRAQFPALANNPGTIYFDNAATTQKPLPVLERMNSYYTEYCANAGRSSHVWARKATAEIEHARKNIADCINARYEDVLFTSGCTASIEIVASTWGHHTLRDGDELLLSPLDHRAAVDPWRRLVERRRKDGVRITIKEYSVRYDGMPDMADIAAKHTPNTRLVVVTDIHNVFGSRTDIGELRRVVGHETAILVDAAQRIGHGPFSVTDGDPDFVAFSGHKMFADTGTGVLWVHPRTTSSFGMPLPLRETIEAGTPHIAGIISLGAAIDYIQSIGLPTIEAHVHALTLRLLDRLNGIPGVEFTRGIAYDGKRAGFGIVSFVLMDSSPAEVDEYLNQHGVYVRSGTHCSAREDDIDGSIRASLHLYNTKEEVDAFADHIASFIQSR
jgi:cysteine desulfurase/selenocysteine lyase